MSRVSINVTYHSKRTQIVGFSFVDPTKKQENCNFSNQYLLFEPPSFTWYHCMVFTFEVDFISKHRFKVWRSIYQNGLQNVDFHLLLFFCRPHLANLTEVGGMEGKQSVFNLPSYSILYYVFIISNVSKLSNAFSSKTWFFILQLQDAISRQLGIASVQREPRSTPHFQLMKLSEYGDHEFFLTNQIQRNYSLCLEICATSNIRVLFCQIRTIQ